MLSSYVFARAVSDGLDAARTASSQRSPQELQELRQVEARLDRTLMVCQAMWLLLSEKLGVTEEELIAKINEVDLSDGRLDGKVRRQPLACPKCSRTVSPRFDRCMYCGQALMADPFA